MMPASTTLASSQPRWGDQKAPITAAPKTSQNPFRHLVGRGAPCVSASSKAPAGHAAVEAVPAGLHWSSQLPVCRRAVLQGSGSAKGWRRRTNVWREATSPARGLKTTKKTKRQRGAISCANAVYFMKPITPLAVAALAFGVWAWHVAPDYVSPPAAPMPLAFTSSSPRSAAADSCRCHGCGCKGGPGWRGQNGQCVSHANLTKDCGSPPSTRCTYEGAQQICPSRG